MNPNEPFWMVVGVKKIFFYFDPAFGRFWVHPCTSGAFRLVFGYFGLININKYINISSLDVSNEHG